MDKKEKIVLTFSVGLIAVGALLFITIPDSFSPSRLSNQNPIGVINSAKGDVQVRLGDTINWKVLKKNDLIYSYSYLFTGPNSAAVYKFIDNSSLSLEENSLVFINFDKQMAEDDETFVFDLLDGNIQMSLPKDSKFKSFKVNDTTIRPSKEKTLMMLKNGEKMVLMVIEGDADVEGLVNVNIKSGEQLDLNSNDVRIGKSDISETEMVDMRKEMANDHSILEAAQKKRNFVYFTKNFINYMYKIFQ